jgi:CRP/FNR family nitrogen fixation transcriptional regulator
MQVRNALARKGVRRQSPNPPPVPPDRSFDMMGAPTAFSRNEEIFGEGEPAEYLFKVKVGGARTFNTLNDGRRQIGAFYLPGDIFGLEAGDIYSVSAEAITRSRILAIKRTEIMARAADDVATVQLVLDLTTKELQRTQGHILLLLKTAQERVVGFLLELAKHEDNQNDFELRMTRQDIADYLGLTIETVSRTLTRLESVSTISLPSSRHVILCNRPALERLNS